MKIIKSIEELKELASQGIEVSIMLAGGFLSSTKYIEYSDKSKKFYITNYIDSSEQCLTEKNLERCTNIVEAINKNCLAII